MAWTFDLLMHRPGAIARVVTEAAVGEHTFTDAAIKESLRLRPPVIAAGRVTSRTVELGPWTIPEGVRIWTPMSLIQRDPEVYEHPNEFRPERFIDQKPPPYMWIPFGGGVRRCLAAPFAMLEMRVVVQTVLSRLKLTPLSETVERTRAEGAIIVPAGGVRVRVEGPRERRRAQAQPARRAARDRERVRPGAGEGAPGGLRHRAVRSLHRRDVGWPGGRARSPRVPASPGDRRPLAGPGGRSPGPTARPCSTRRGRSDSATPPPRALAPMSASRRRPGSRPCPGCCSSSSLRSRSRARRGARRSRMSRAG